MTLFFKKITFRSERRLSLLASMRQLIRYLCHVQTLVCARTESISRVKLPINESDTLIDIPLKCVWPS